MSSPVTPTSRNIFSPSPTQPRASSLEPFYPNTITASAPTVTTFSSMAPRPASSSVPQAEVSDNSLPQPETPTSRLLTYLFSPEQYPSSFESIIGHYKSLPDYAQRHQLTPEEDWGEIGARLRDASFRRE